MKEDGKCLECQLANALKERDNWKKDAMRYAANAAYWEERARKAELELDQVETVLTEALKEE